MKSFSISICVLSALFQRENTEGFLIETYFIMGIRRPFARLL